MIIYMWAQDKLGLIGQDNRLPWNNQEEMNLFIKLTKYQNLVIGNNTYKSIPNKPLKEKGKIYVLSKKLQKDSSNVVYTNNYKEIINLSKKEDLIVIGGKEIYNLFSNYVSELWVSILNDKFKGNIYLDDLIKGNEIEIFYNCEYNLIKYERYVSFKFYKYKKISLSI